MNVAILHEPVAADAPPDAQDVLVQAQAVHAALCHAGHHATLLAFNANTLAEQLRALGTQAVFNLVETQDGSCNGAEQAPMLLEAMRVPFTGCGAQAMRAATDKLACKQVLHAQAIATPRHYALEMLERGVKVVPGRYIVKSVWEHGSLGLEADCVVLASEATHLATAVRERLPRLGGTAFAEAFVVGREFNLALLETADGKDVQCLPPAEIRFGATSLPRIVGYRAKWASGSAEDRATPRGFDFPARDAQLLTELRQAAQAVWRAFGLRGYARVDFRVDEQNCPWVIDVNTNPCLSPDAGFAAALAQAQLSFPQLVNRLLQAALTHHG